MHGLAHSKVHMINMKSPILRPYKPMLLAGLLLARMPRLAREIDFTSERVPDGSGNALCRIAPKTRQGNNPSLYWLKGNQSTPNQVSTGP